jgi:hypothetical protein
VTHSRLILVSLVASCALSSGCLYVEFYLGTQITETTGTGGTGGATSSTSTGGAGGGPACLPKATRPCYDGPAGTEGQGICTAGMQACGADGASWGPCAGQVLPQMEDCATPEDEDCDGQAPACKGHLLWAERFGDAKDQKATGVAVDAAGNVIVVGHFQGSIDFGSGPMPSAGDEDIFVVKLSPAGQTLWAKTFGDAKYQTAGGVAVDSAGNVLFIGSFYGSVDFGGGALPGAGGQDVFLAKLDAAGGFLWAKSFGDADFQVGAGVAVDAADDVLLTGSFNGSIDFGGSLLTSSGLGDVFAAKLHADGSHVWSKGFGDATDQAAAGIAVDAAGNVALTGAFYGAINFGGGPLTSAGGLDVFVASLDAAGGHRWSRRFGDLSDQTAAGVGADHDGNVVLAGSFAGTIDFGSTSLTSLGGQDAFVLKLGPDGDPAGSQAWGRSFGDSTDQVATGVTVDSGGNVIATGAFFGLVNFGGGPLPSAGGEDVFLLKLSASGEHVWSERFGAAGNETSTAVSADASGNLLLTGYFSGAPDFGGGPLVSAGGTDIFIAKFSP